MYSSNVGISISFDKNLTYMRINTGNRMCINRLHYEKNRKLTLREKSSDVNVNKDLSVSVFLNSARIIEEVTILVKVHEYPFSLHFILNTKLMLTVSMLNILLC